MSHVAVTALIIIIMFCYEFNFILKCFILIYNEHSSWCVNVDSLFFKCIENTYNLELYSNALSDELTLLLKLKLWKCFRFF